MGHGLWIHNLELPISYFDDIDLGRAAGRGLANAPIPGRGVLDQGLNIRQRVLDPVIQLRQQQFLPVCSKKQRAPQAGRQLLI